jgi:hypothetical protein
MKKRIKKWIHPRWKDAERNGLIPPPPHRAIIIMENGCPQWRADGLEPYCDVMFAFGPDGLEIVRGLPPHAFELLGRNALLKRGATLLRALLGLTDSYYGVPAIPCIRRSPPVVLDELPKRQKCIHFPRRRRDASRKDTVKVEVLKGGRLRSNKRLPNNRKGSRGDDGRLVKRNQAAEI